MDVPSAFIDRLDRTPGLECSPSPRSGTVRNTLPIVIDIKSLLVQVDASQSLDALETELAARGFTLGVAAPVDALTLPVGEWLAQGAAGAPSSFADPSDHLVAGLEATLLDGKKLEVRPEPRRAVGPDLTALLLGAHGRFGRIERVWLRIHSLEAQRPAMPLPGVDLDPPVTREEAHLLDSIERALSENSSEPGI